LNAKNAKKMKNDCIKRAENFSEEKFIKEMKRMVK